MPRDEDLVRVAALHRQVAGRLIKGCLSGAADPDLREFAAGLPEEMATAEPHLKRFWARKGMGPDRVREFAVRYGRALAGCTGFQAFEREMEELGRLAGTEGFAARLAEVAAGYGVDPQTL